MTRKQGPRRIAVFTESIDMSRIPDQCIPHVIYSILTPYQERGFRLAIYKLPEGEKCSPSCDGEEPLREPWRCRKLVMCCEDNYMVTREWIATK